MGSVIVNQGYCRSPAIREAVLGRMRTLKLFDSFHGWYCSIVEMPFMFHVTMRITE
jgi:hypothetical protein